MVQSCRPEYGVCAGRYLTKGTATLQKSSIEFETVIGLEVHAQVLTRSKMYCGCSADYASTEPNTHVCQVCMGAPGAMPYANRKAIESVVLTGLALGSSVSEFSKLDRKNYVYPDLPKGYQISQYDMPLCVGGTLDFESEGSKVSAGITRVHIEEDTGRLLHRTDVNGLDVSLVDLNRSGVPLMEIVGDPDLRSPAQARDYLTTLRQILRYIGTSTGNMEDGAFRCDANISTRSLDGAIVGAKVEIKNMNSFRAVERALKFEESRQRQILIGGGTIDQETRGWVDAAGITVGQRSKEQAHDYRYFPEPDLPPIVLSESSVASIRERMIELPAQRRDRFVEAYGLSVADAETLTAERTIADYFETVAQSSAANARPRAAANWIINDVFGLQREDSASQEALPISTDQLIGIIDLVESNAITGRGAKELLPQIQANESAQEAATRLNLLSLDDSDAIIAAARQAMDDFPAAVADYRSGKTAAIGRLLGETIRITGGRARPDAVRAVLLELLGGE
jgi:aspartyl-tRNA(Asn)/glutamyl-tRNA(Gln) amidotransferase subunit B